MDIQKIRMATSEELQIAKIRRRKTNEQIAEASGLSLSTVNRLIAGTRTADLHQIAVIADALGLDRDELTFRIFETAAANVSASRENNGSDEFDLLAESEIPAADAYGLAAQRATRKVDAEPHAE
ncbi:transcriptional regulator with XRE-family HTH domain [Mycetocola sp. BIGb0189]|uniref:helix-turn-helix domain-containing protein n=1 Tax=Mycetocola sp. BIGb0189 TaxID=2940604 RepID=UPI002166E888|nr:helix-turn-helix transcriptional regulator [Mycetocola sp. BIGb0189]MCS4277401.1 transcriptional regulator with XRE-family HTH domain [Mycetocola sp. BIGb0189]